MGQKKFKHIYQFTQTEFAMIIEVEQIIKLVLAFVLSGIVGLEREVSLKPAGLRTHSLVGLGSALLTILSTEAFSGSDPARIAAAVIVGVGFIGAGTILKTEEKIIGLTTAATLWTTAAIGVTVGAGFYLLAIVATVLTYISLKLGMFTSS
jgi:putative Mg2+ transporter-C (MgtC) family protein